MIKAPTFFLTAVGAARVVGGPPAPAVPLLLVFHGHLGADIASRINEAIRSQDIDIDRLLIASIVDLHHVPRFMRPAVSLTLNAAYRHAASQLPASFSPSEYVLIAPDWTGKVTRNFGMEQRFNDVGVALVTNSWVISNSYIGPDPITATQEMVGMAIHATPAD